MRIPCPYCGERDRLEFSILGEDLGARPDGLDTSPDAMFQYVYGRKNVAGLHDELWYHAAGCHAWLVVRRNTLTHEIAAVHPARDVEAREGHS